MNQKQLKLRREKIKFRIRKRISGTTERPRLSVYRSGRHITAQLIDDVNSRTILTVTSASKEIIESKDSKTKSDFSTLVGKAVAKKAKEKNIEAVVFDRNGYLYHGRVKALAEGAREGGLKF